MNWRPQHPNHAIERTRIAIQFKDNLPQKTIKSLGEGFNSTRADFSFGPRIEVQTHTLSIQTDKPSAASVVQQDRGWQFVREAAPGVIVEAVVLDHEGLVYENVEYVRWTDFWGRAEQILRPLVEGASAVTDLRLFAIEYFDRFIYRGPLEDASPDELINEVLTATLTNSARGGRELWHIHRGWYETYEGTRVLINQNLDANENKLPSGELARTVGVYTKVERRNKNEIVDAAEIWHEMVKMHVISKEVFMSAISQMAQGLVGIENDSHR